MARPDQATMMYWRSICCQVPVALMGRVAQCMRCRASFDLHQGDWAKFAYMVMWDPWTDILRMMEP